MGVYKGGASYYHNISENVNMVSHFYSYKDGYFGKKSKSKDNYVRIIESKNPLQTAKDFYDKIAYGGIENPLEGGKGHTTKMEDGTILTFRPTSSSDGSPAVDINIKGSDAHGKLKSQKIHFTEEK
ncbi:MAG: hypothetical protein Q4F12_03425 [Erysipelotrichaceae bacterium]|nr:hypothetical protein [Erysipelotrichaceae bacterium]